MNKKQFIEKYNGANFIRNIENLKSKEQLESQLLDEISKQGLSPDLLEYDADCSCFRIDHYSWRIDKRKQDQIGIITFRSKDYIFKFEDKESYGDIPPAKQFNDNGFYILDCYGNKVTYRLENK